VLSDDQHRDSGSRDSRANKMKTQNRPLSAPHHHTLHTEHTRNNYCCVFVTGVSFLCFVHFSLRFLFGSTTSPPRVSRRLKTSGLVRGATLISRRRPPPPKCAVIIVLYYTTMYYACRYTVYKLIIYIIENYKCTRPRII